jgi:hypothetical protein
MPNAYSADFTKELLGILLTIQRDEAIAAAQRGINPRLQILSERQLLALDSLLARYGYQKPFTALQMYKAVTDGARWAIPDLSTIPTFTKADVSFHAAMPFADHEYFSSCNDLQSIEHAVVEAQVLTTTRSGMLVSNVNVGDEFGIDEEGLEMFFEFEVEYALIPCLQPST